MYRKIKNPWLDKEGYNCIGCAPNNPIGLHMEFHVDGEDVIGIWKPEQNYQGWIDVLHGGIQSLMMDEVGRWFVGYHKGVNAVTKELNVKFLKTVSTRWEKIKVRAKKVSEERADIKVHMDLINPDGEICATADATYFMNPRQLRNESLRIRYELEN